MDTDYQIGEEGKTTLDGMLAETPGEEIPKFVVEFRANHSLKHKELEPGLALLEMCGTSFHTAHDAILRAATTELVRLVKQAAAAGEPHILDALLDRTFRYLTVDEMRDVSLAVLESVDEEKIGIARWEQIVDNGLMQQPYTILPLSLKRKLWDRCPEAFACEVDNVLMAVKDHRIVAENDPCDVAMDADTVERIGELCKLMIRGRDSACAKSAETVLERCLEVVQREDSESRRTAMANVLIGALADESIRAASKKGSERLSRACALAALVAEKLAAEGMDRAYAHDVGEAEAALFGELVTGETGEVTELGANGSSVLEAMALLLHSSAARSVFAGGLLQRLLTCYSMTPEQLSLDAWLHNLTALVQTSIHAKRVIDSREPVTEREINGFCESYFPLLLSEILKDSEWITRSATTEVCVDLPDSRLVEAMRRGCLERRIAVTYLRQLLATNKYSIPSRACGMRYRMVLDAVAGLTAGPQGARGEPGEELDHFGAMWLVHVCLADEL